MTIPRWLAGKATARACHPSGGHNPRRLPIQRPAETTSPSIPFQIPYPSPFPPLATRLHSTSVTTVAPEQLEAMAPHRRRDRKGNSFQKKAVREPREPGEDSKKPEGARLPGSYYREKYGPKSNQTEEGGETRERRPRKTRQTESPGIELKLNDNSLQILQNTVSEAEALLPDAEHQRHADAAHVPVEIARFQKWRLDPADAEQRSHELQM